MAVKKEILLQVDRLKKYFPANAIILKRKQSAIKAVDGVSFAIEKGQTMGLVGESGCGKTTIGKMIVRLHKPTEGKIWFDHKEINGMNDKEMLDYRKKAQMIFQDPYASLDPRMKVKNIIGEALDIHRSYNSKLHRKEIVDELLNKVKLPRLYAERYPNELSGGQRQRVGIARSLAVGPEFLVCDEPVSALDVSVQAQIVSMLKELQSDMELTYLFISHDLSMVKYISDKIGVMYLGKLVETADCDELFQHPVHPYTQALLSSIPSLNLDHQRKRFILEGELPNPLDLPIGCRFRIRCPYAKEICSEIEPEMKEVIINHWAACHRI